MQLQNSSCRGSAAPKLLKLLLKLLLLALFMADTFTFLCFLLDLDGLATGTFDSVSRVVGTSSAYEPAYDGSFHFAPFLCRWLFAYRTRLRLGAWVTTVAAQLHCPLNITSLGSPLKARLGTWIVSHDVSAESESDVQGASLPPKALVCTTNVIVAGRLPPAAPVPVMIVHWVARL